MWIKISGREELFNINVFQSLKFEKIGSEYCIRGIKPDEHKVTIFKSERKDIAEVTWKDIQEQIFKQQVQIVPMPIPVAGGSPGGMPSNIPPNLLTK